MRPFNCIIFFLLIFQNVKAQQNHFIYIQADNKQAFYLKLNDKVISSTFSGYAIISKLTDGVYKLAIGFPKNEWPIQNIDFSIKGKDEGFLLKNFGDKGWGLFNMQTMEVVMGTSEAVVIPPPVENKTDAFSIALAEVTNTPSIMQVDPVKDTNTTGTTAKAIVVQEEIKRNEAAAAISALQIKQVFSDIDLTGRSMIYTIAGSDRTDSVTMFIPYENKEALQTMKDAEAAANAAMFDSSGKMNDSVSKIIDSLKNDAVEKTSGVNGNQRDSVAEQKTLVTDIKVTDPATNKNEYKITIVNPLCKATATDDDFLKLRKKMAGAETDESMIAVAKKGYKSKCYTTDHVKQLSLLFLKDEGKYGFFDASYNHVSDIGNFKSLQSELTEEYYITRFKAMLR